MTEDWRIVTTKPAVLADAVEVLPPLLRLRNANPRPAWRKRFVLLRWADLLRRALPADAFRVLDEELPAADESDVPHLTEPAVRAAALLERGQWEEAVPWVMQVERRGGARELLDGRVALQQQRFQEADQAWDLAEAAARSSTHPLAVEVAAEALGYRARLAMLSDEMKASHWGRLERLLEEHGAGFSQSIFRGLKALDDGDAKGRQETAFAKVHHELVTRYRDPFQAEADKVAPVPVVVHGVAKTHAREPKRFFEAVTALSALAWRNGDRQHGYDIAWYGRAIGKRLFGEKMDEAMSNYLERLLDPVEPERRGVYEWRLLFRAKVSERQRAQG